MSENPGDGPQRPSSEFPQEAHCAGAGVSQPALLAVVAIGGLATMVVELGAVRVLAPWFGTSSSVWTNVIGVVLAALALGYTLGARLAGGPRPQVLLGRVLLVASLLSILLLVVAAPLANVLMPEGIPLHRAAGALVWGSLSCAAVLFLPAATALGCAGPLAVECLQRSQGGAAGAAGGKVLAASTVGSLVGTFGTTHWAIPTLGIQGAYVAAAVLLAACGTLLMVHARSAGASVALLLLGASALGAVSLNSGPHGRAVRDGEILLGSLESPTQSIRAIETVDAHGDPLRVLRVNEALDSFQSVWSPKAGLLPDGHYYNHFALPYGWQTRENGSPPESWRTLILGLGAGTAVRVLEGVMAETTELETVGIEVDEGVLQVAESHFGLVRDVPARVAVGGLDGRAALRFIEGEFDQIVLDAYANNMEIPHHLATVEAFRLYASRLKVGGWMTVNVGGFGPSDPVVSAVAASAAEGFQGPVACSRVPLSRNWVLFARKDAGLPQPGERAFGSRGARLPAQLEKLIAPLEVPGAWVTVSSEETSLHDASGSTERLQARSIRAAAARLAALDVVTEPAPSPEVEPSASSRDLELVQAAQAFAQRRDFTDALAAAEDIAHPATKGRTLADLHWRAGSPMAAFEIASAAIQASPNDLALLALTVDTGFAAGAIAASTIRLERLRKRVTGVERWAPTLDRLESFAREAASGERGAMGAIWRSRLVLGVMGLLVTAFAFSAFRSGPVLC